MDSNASPGSRQGKAFASASRRADSLLSYAWLYVFTDAASPEALRYASHLLANSPHMLLSSHFITQQVHRC